MTKTGLKIIPFSSSDEHYEILYKLEQSLDYHVKDFGSIELLKYHASLIPEKCKPINNFLELDNLKNKLTSTKQDNCNQKAAGDEWQNSPLSKRYTKKPDTLQKLRDAGRLIEK